MRLPLIKQLQCWLGASLTNRIGFSMVGIALLFSLLVAGASFAYVANLSHRWQAEKVRDSLNKAGERATFLLNAIAEDTRTLARNPQVVSAVLDAADQEAYLHTLFDSFQPQGRHARSHCLANFKGLTVGCNLHPHPDYSREPWIRATIDQSRTQALLLQRQGESVLLLAQPVLYEASGGPEGALVSEYALPHLLEASLGFLDRSFQIRLHSGGQPVVTLGPAVMRGETLLQTLPLTEPLKPLQLQLALTIPSQALEAPLAPLALVYLTLALLLAGATWITARRVAATITRRLEIMTLQAEKTASSGRMQYGVIQSGTDEVARLSHAFAAMTERAMQTHQQLEQRVDERTAELSKAEARYRALFADSQAVMLLIDPQTGQIVDANAAASAYYGYDLPALRQLNVSAINTLSPDEIRARMQHAETGQRRWFEFRHRLASGEVRDVNVASGPIETDGRTLLLSTSIDITERKSQETALRRNEARLENIIEGTGAGTWEWDFVSDRISCNERWASISGRTPDELGILDAAAWNEQIHPDDRILFEHAFGEHTAGKSPSFQCEYRVRAHPDRWIWVQDHGRITERDAGEQPLLMSGIRSDITERRRAEEALIESLAYNSTLFSATLIPLVIAEPETLRFQDCNPAAVAIYRMGSREELLGLTPLDVSTPTQYDGTPSAEAAQSHIRNALENGSDLFEWRHVRPSGEVWDAEVNLMTLHYNGKRLLQFSLQDISLRKRAEAGMREALVVFNASSQGIMTTDGRGIITNVNPAFCNITGFEADEVVGHRASVFKSGHHQPEFYHDMWAALAEKGEWEGEIWNRRTSGESYPQWLSISAVRDNRGQAVEYVALFSDISERKKQEEIVWRQANYDPLTGLANRNLFHDRLERALAQARRNHANVGLMFIDLDGFKWINDTLGHDTGDKLLIEVAERLRGCVRDQDTVARLGGDEFTIVLQEVGEAANLRSIGEKVVGVLRDPFTLGGKPHHISGSVGITIFPDDGPDVQTLLRNADIAMYQSKQSGKNRCQFYAHHMQVSAQARMQTEADLRIALQQKAFALHYQPIVDADSGELIGAEALIRWQHPERGLVSPLDFIPVAEESGLIVGIGEWALREAAEQWQRWCAAGHPPLRLAVNVSGVQFRESDFSERIGRVLSECGIERGHLMLEITESVLMDGSEESEARMRDIKSQGIGYSLDDFGTGFSSLSYLKRFPVDIVKIDRSFVRDCPDDRNDAHLVEAIINMAHSLDLRVTAEGVETSAQLEFLRDLGCDYLQGYLIGKPVPAETFEALFSRRRLLPEQSHSSLEADRLLAALRHDTLDIDEWLGRLLGERSPEMRTFIAEQSWVCHGLDLRHAVENHLRWRQRLHNVVSGDELTMESDEACSITRCALGGWILERESSPAIDRLDHLHREFHKQAGQIIADFNLGYRDSARRNLVGLRFRKASRDVVVALIDCFQEQATVRLA